MSTNELVRELGRAGTFSAATALDAGLTDRVLRTAVRSGQLVRLTRGRYALPAAPTAEPAADRVREHRRIAEAILDRYDGRAALSHHSALACQGLPLYRVDLATVHLTSRAGTTFRCRADHVLHPADASTANLAPAYGQVCVADALVQTGRRSGAKALLVAGDAALHRRLVTVADLRAAAASGPRGKGIPVVRATIERLDGRSESPGESLLRWQIQSWGLEVDPQVEVVTARGRYRLDLVVRGTRVAVEFDGLGKYANHEAFRAEKEREEDLRAEGWIFARFGWPDLGRPELIRDRLDRALRAAAGSGVTAPFRP